MDTPVRKNEIIPWEVASEVAAPQTAKPAFRRKLTARRRAARRGFGLKLGLVLTLCVGLLAASTAVARRGGTSPVEQILALSDVPMTVAVTVQPGDTLWSLAGRYGNPKASILDRVDSLIATNGFQGAAPLHPGQKILVRVEHPTELAKLRLRQAGGRLANASR